MLITLTILLALSLGWLAKKLIKTYPNSPHPRLFKRRIRPITKLADLLIKKISELIKKSAA
jgi:hypothetical protein